MHALPPILDEDIPCRRCKYNLRALQRSGLCPECATPVMQSAGPQMLRYADPDWVAGIAFASRLITWSIGAAIVTFVGLWIFMVMALSAQNMESLALVALGAQLAILLTGVTGVVGQWRMVSRDPRGLEHAEQRRTRAILRGAIVFALPLALAVQLFAPPDPSEPFRLMLDAAAKAAWFVWIAGLMAYALHLRRLTERIPDERQMADWRRMFWLLVGLIGLTIAAVLVQATMETLNRVYPPTASTQPLGGPPGVLFVRTQSRGALADVLEQLALWLPILLGILTVVIVFYFVGLQGRFGKTCRAQAALARQNRDRSAGGSEQPR